MGRRRLAMVCIAAKFIAAAPVFGQAGARVHGAIFDSVGSIPLSGARIEVVSAVDRSRIAYTATSDSLGRFALAGVDRGRYIAGFFHPLLDSLGLAVSQRWLDVPSGARDVRFDLAVPSGIRIQRALCEPNADKAEATDSSGVIIGYVLSAHTLLPQSDATVIAQWAEYTISRAGMQRTLMMRSSTSVVGGWFAVCGLPSAADVVVRVVSGSDTSGAIEIRVPETRLARRTLYVASREVLAVAPLRDTLVRNAFRTANATSIEVVPQGTVVSGWVRTEDGVPIPGAQVRLHGSTVRGVTDDDGAFALVGVPGGTQTLQTRAIGFVPDERAVDVTDQHLPIIVGLTSLRRFIDTVHVRATRVDLTSLVGFETRRRAGGGRFFSARDIERLHPREVTDVLRHAPSLQLVSLGTFGYAVRMRGELQACTPALFLDGKQLVHWQLADLNGLVQPDEIGGMEIYTPAMTPAEFRTRDSCSTILIWTRTPERLKPRR